MLIKIKSAFKFEMQCQSLLSLKHYISTMVVESKLFTIARDKSVSSSDFVNDGRIIF